MNDAKINCAPLNISVLNAIHLNVLGFGRGKGSGGVVPPEPIDNVWLWGNGETVLWGDGTNVLTEQE